MRACLPVNVPDSLWSRPDMRAALAAGAADGAIGPLLKLVQQYTGASQSQLAFALDTTQARISKYVNDVIRVERMEMFQRIADGLGMPDEARMAFGLAPRSVPPAPVAMSGTDDVMTGVTPTAATAVRGVTAEITSLVFTSLGGGAQPVQDTDRRGAGRRPIDLLRNWSGGEDRCSTGVLHLAPGRLGLEQIKQLETTADAFRVWDHQFGGGLRRKAVIGQLSEVSDLLDEQNPNAVTHLLLGVAARLAITAAQMSDDIGRRSEAFRYLKLALMAARESGDHVVGARVANSMARKHLQSGADGPGIALQLIQEARRRLGQRLGGDAKALLITTEAWIKAHHGADSAVRRTLEEAAELVAVHDGTTSLFGPAELAGVAGACFEVLAKSDRAGAERHLVESEGRIRQALRLRDGVYVRSRVLDFVGLGNVHLAQGEVGQACQDVRRATELAAGLRSPRVTRRIHRFAVGALELHPDHDGVWDLAECVRTRLPVASR